MTTTPEPTKQVPRIEGNPAPSLRGDHNDLADWVRDHTGESVPDVTSLPTTGVWPGRTIYVVATDAMYVYKNGWLLLAGDRVDGTFGYASGMSNVASAKSRLSRVGDDVTWHAAIQCTSNFNAGFQVGTLPAGFRPPDQEVVVGSLVAGANPGVISVLIAPNGIVTTGGYVTSTTSGQLKFTHRWTL